MNHSIQNIIIPVDERIYRVANYRSRAKLEAIISIIQGKICLENWRVGEETLDQDFVEDGSPDIDIMAIFEKKKAKFREFLSQLKVEDIDLSGYVPNAKFGSRIASRWRTFR